MPQTLQQTNWNHPNQAIIIYYYPIEENVNVWKN
jgi:hypothetical protein